MNRKQLFGLTALATAMVVASALARSAGPPDYDLSWNTVDGGGGTSTGASYELSGTIGQPDASVTPMAAGGYEVIGGFWSGIDTTPVNTCPGDIQPDGGNGVVDVDDLLVLINSWGACASCDADLQPNGGNGVVDVDDLLVLINAWGPCP